MNKITERVIEEAKYMKESGKTIREVAKTFKVSKSTVHKDLHERLKKINSLLYEQINNILVFHNSIRHIRGGESTRLKYLK